MQKCCTVPKKPKKPKFGDLGLLQGLEVSKLWFFWFFLGQYGIFACFCSKRLVFLAQKDWFFWDSTAFLQSQASKVLYCPKKTNLFKAKSAKMLYCPKKTKKSVFAVPGPGGLQTLVFLVFFGTVRHFCLFLLKKIGFFGTVQRFCSPRPRKCCAVPKKPIF